MSDDPQRPRGRDSEIGSARDCAGGKRDMGAVEQSEPRAGAGSRSEEAGFLSEEWVEGDAADSDYAVDSRWLSWKGSALRRRVAVADDTAGSEDDQRAEPFGSLGAFRGWCGTAVRALLDVQFRTSATRTLLPLAYLLGLAFAVAIPLILIVALWHLSALLGLIFAIVVALPLGLTIAASVRLVLEFLVNASRLATRVEHINTLADDLFQALSDVAEPVNQLSEDVRAVQFWRFRKRPPRK